MRFFLACIDLGIGDLAIRESTHEAFHTLQAAPFGFPVNLIRAHFPLRNLVGFHFAEVATCVCLASIFGKDCTFARRRIHLALVLIALSFTHIVRVDLSLAFLHFGVICPSCGFASTLGFEILVQETARESAAPSSTTGFRAFCSMDMPATYGQ
jgi:hypothetical protein